MKGSPENPWAEAFSGWSHQIGRHVGKPLHDLLVADFSTTGPVERAVSEVVMMDIFERYFHYVALCVCGIPSVTLEGTVADWERLEQKVEGLARFDLDWWLEHLRPICRQFVLAAKGQPDISHWQNICKLQSDYGGDVVNGWIARLFPYLRSFTNGPVRTKNPIFENGKGFQTAFAPSGLSRVPFTWSIELPGSTPLKYAMEGIGGFVGITQDPATKALRPMVGWAVAESSSIETAIDRVRRYHQTAPKAPDSPRTWRYRRLKSGDEVCRTNLPEDMAAFYDATDGATVNDSQVQLQFSILPLGELLPQTATAHRIGGESDFNDRPFPWARFCQFSDGSSLIIALSECKHGWCKTTPTEAQFWAILRRHADAIALAQSGDRSKFETLESAARRKCAPRTELISMSPAHIAQKVELDALRTRTEQQIYLVLHMPIGTTHFNREFRIVAKSFTEFLHRTLDSNGEHWWEKPDAIEYGVCPSGRFDAVQHKKHSPGDVRLVRMRFSHSRR